MLNNFTVCLTHDVDRVHKGYQKLTRVFSSLINLEMESAAYHILSIFARKNPYWNFETIINIEKQNNVRSTFFFLNESMKHDVFRPSTWKLSLGRYSINDPDVTKYIVWLDKNGWEVALHGSYHSYKSFRMLQAEKSNLEDILGHEIIGIRQHYLKLNQETWRFQADAGFRYDASYGYTDKIGFKSRRYQPFCPFQNDNSFRVFPLAIMDFGVMKKRATVEKIIDLIDHAQANKAVLVANWHQRVFNDNEFPNFIKNYEFFIKECQKRNADFRLLKDLV